MQKVRIGDLLVERKLISQDQLQEALVTQQRTGVKLGFALVELGFIEEDTLLNTLAKQLQIPFIELQSYDCDPEKVRLLPEMHARRFRAIILEKRSQTLLVGMADPQNIFAYDELQALLGTDIDVALVQEAALLRAFELYYDYSEEINRFAEELSGVLQASGISQEQDTLLADDDSPVVKLLQSLFEEAIRLNASDIHIEPLAESLLIRLRVDGQLQEMRLKERGVVAALIQRLKLMAGLNIAEKRLPQDGRFHMVVNKQAIDVRLATIPAQDGEAVVMRLLRRILDKMSLDDIHMPSEVLSGTRDLIARPHGMFLVTGPTGSGKTTTLYSVLHELNQARVKIITVEDPVEYRMSRICQVQINPKIDLSFARVLKAMLRHDPDIIMVGEIRDKESAEIAMRAAMTGHLVLATLHTNDASSTAVRLIDMGIESFLVASAVRGILAQRLVRKNCQNCVTTVVPTQAEAWWVDSVYPSQDKPKQFLQGTGCVHCSQTGFLGRQAVQACRAAPDALRPS